MGKIKWEKWASVLICLGGGALLAYLTLRYLLPIVLPFLIAFAISLLIRPLAARFSARTSLPQKPCAVGFFVFFLILTVLLLGAATHRLLTELGELPERLLTGEEDFSALFQGSVDFFEAVTSKIGFLQQIGAGERFEAFRDAFNAMVSDMLGSLLNGLAAEIPALLGKIIASLPTVFLAVVVTLIAGFYFCIDGEEIVSRTEGCLPSAIRARLPRWNGSARRLSFRYLRAYLLLLVLTFVELFVGFLILGVDYAFLLAMLIALVDLLPILGVGTVLVPWAVVLLIQHRYYVGFGLLILYGAVTVLRQIFESRLVGKSLGLSPILTLFATWAGWQLLGFWGMVIAPFAALLLKSVVTLARRER